MLHITLTRILVIFVLCQQVDVNIFLNLLAAENYSIIFHSSGFCSGKLHER